MKIAIIGSPGSGKSTLAFKLQEITGLPLYHLDQYFWKPGWERPDREKFAVIHDALCDASEWIIEGMAVRHLEYRIQQADIVIFLDISLYRCLYRTYKRAFFGWGTVRDSSAKECPERMPTFEFLQYILEFNRKQKPKIEALFRQYKMQKKFFVLKNSQAIDDLVRKFKIGEI